MAVIATGFFDGVHLGHRQIIKTLLECASIRSEKSLTVTFWPHPRVALGLDASSLNLLTSREERLEMLRSLGVDEVVELEFTRDFAAMTTKQYLQMLVRDFDATCIVLGYDNRLGADQLPPEESAAIARSLGLEAVIVPPLKVVVGRKSAFGDDAPDEAGTPALPVPAGAAADESPEADILALPVPAGAAADEYEVVVSSSKIRRAIEAGDIDLAEKMLGYSLKKRIFER